MHQAYIKCISCQCDRDWGTMFPLCGAQCGQGQQPLVWAWQTAWGFLKYRVQRQIWGEFGETNAHSPCCMGSMLVGGGGSPLIKKIRLNGLQEEKSYCRKRNRVFCPSHTVTVVVGPAGNTVLSLTTKSLSGGGCGCPKHFETGRSTSIIIIIIIISIIIIVVINLFCQFRLCRRTSKCC